MRSKQPANEGGKYRLFGHIPWLTQSRSARFGALFVAPPLLFVASNIGVYNLGLEEAEWLFPDGVVGSIISHPIILFGLLTMALIANLAAVIQVSAKAKARDIIVNKLIIHMHPQNIAVFLIAGMTLTFMFGYLVFENLSHLVSQ